MQVRLFIRSASVVVSPPDEIVAPSGVMVGAASGEASKFGIGVVRARAMLQLFEPRSRTFGKVRLISYSFCQFSWCSVDEIDAAGRTRRRSHSRMATSSFR